MSPNDTQPDYHIPIVQHINNGIRRFCELMAWLNVILIVVILTQVVLRYGFNNGQVYLEELIWHLYAAAFMFGLSYAMINNSHIRVDVIHMHLSPRVQYFWEIVGLLLFVFPFLIIIGWQSWEWVQESYRLGENSPNATGLPHRWIIKAAIPLSFLLMFIVSLARLLESVLLLFQHGKIPAMRDDARVSLLKHLFQVQVNAKTQQ